MSVRSWLVISFFFFFNDTATTEIYTLSLHDALPISGFEYSGTFKGPLLDEADAWIDRKSTRLNSSHLVISYAVFCLKKTKTKTTNNKHLDTLLNACQQPDSRTAH